MAWEAPLLSFPPHVPPSSWELLRPHGISIPWLSHLQKLFPPLHFSQHPTLGWLFIWGYSRHPSLRILSIFLPGTISDFHYTCLGTFRPMTWAFPEFSYVLSIHSVPFVLSTLKSWDLKLLDPITPVWQTVFLGLTQLLIFLCACILTVQTNYRKTKQPSY